jgi:hypothetical protein
MEPRRIDNDYAIRDANLPNHYEIFAYYEDDGTIRRQPGGQHIVLSEYALHELASRICEPDGCDELQDAKADIEQQRQAAWALIVALFDAVADAPHDEYAEWLDDVCNEQLIALRDAIGMSE